MKSISSRSDRSRKVKRSQDDTRSSRERELRYHAIFVFDLNGIHLNVNQQAAKSLG